MTQRDLDDLFKRGSEKYEFSYRPDAWQQMDAMLEKQGQNRRRRWILLLLFLGLSLAGIAYYWSTSAVALEAEKIDQPIVVDQTPNEKNGLESKQGQLLLDPDIKENNPAQEEHVINKIPNSKPEITTATEYQSSAPNKPNVVKSPSSSVLGENQRKAKNDTKAGATSPAPKEQSSLRIEPIFAPEPNTSEPEERKEEIPSFLDNQMVELTKYSFTKIPTLYFKPEILETANPLAEMPKPATEKDEINSLNNKMNWAFGTVLSADLNSVGIINQTQVGWSAGLSTEVRIGKKWSLGLGVNYSKKDYVAGEGKYKMQDVPYLSPKVAWATCNIMQVPLQLSYYKNGFSSKGLFASIGLNSYFMNREKFKFEYDDSLPNPGIMEWEERGTNKHIFGVSQFNFGYQGKLGEKALWQVSPYVQVPLSGIGHGSVDLYSFGIQMNFKLLTK